MINGLMTLQGAWDKLRTDPIILRMFVLSLGFYGMSTFEGSDDVDPRRELALSHYTQTGQSVTFTLAHLAGTA